MSRNKDLRDRVIKFAQSYYKKHEAAPPMRLIYEKCKTNYLQLKEEFPGGLAQICEKSGIPVPFDRVHRTEKAREKRAQKIGTEQQTKRLAVPVEGEELKGFGDFQASLSRSQKEEQLRDQICQKMAEQILLAYRQDIPLIKKALVKVFPSFLKEEYGVKYDLGDIRTVAGMVAVWEAGGLDLKELVDLLPEWVALVKDDLAGPFFKDLVEAARKSGRTAREEVESWIDEFAEKVDEARKAEEAAEHSMAKMRQEKEVLESRVQELRMEEEQLEARLKNMDQVLSWKHGELKRCDEKLKSYAEKIQKAEKSHQEYLKSLDEDKARAKQKIIEEIQREREKKANEISDLEESRKKVADLLKKETEELGLLQTRNKELRLQVNRKDEMRTDGGWLKRSLPRSRGLKR